MLSNVDFSLIPLIFPFWKCYIKGILHYKMLTTDLFSLSIMSLRFAQVAVSIVDYSSVAMFIWSCRNEVYSKPLAGYAPRAEMAEAWVAGLCSGCRCLKNTVCLLRTSRWLSLQVVKPLYVRRTVCHFCWEKLWIFPFPSYSQQNEWLSRVQGLFQGIAGTMGSSQMHCSHRCSSGRKPLLPGMSQMQNFVSPAAGHFSSPVGHSPMLSKKKKKEKERSLSYPNLYFILKVFNYMNLNPNFLTIHTATHTHELSWDFPPQLTALLKP